MAEKPTGITVAPLKQSHRKPSPDFLPNTKNPSLELISAKWGSTVWAPESDSMIERITPLPEMSATPWFSALGTLPSSGGQLEKLTSKPSLSRKPPPTATCIGV
jgi:hypothetical protein